MALWGRSSKGASTTDQSETRADQLGANGLTDQASTPDELIHVPKVERPIDSGTF